MLVYLVVLLDDNKKGGVEGFYILGNGWERERNKKSEYFHCWTLCCSCPPCPFLFVSSLNTLTSVQGMHLSPPLCFFFLWFLLILMDSYMLEEMRHRNVPCLFVFLFVLVITTEKFYPHFMVFSIEMFRVQILPSLL